MRNERRRRRRIVRSDGCRGGSLSAHNLLKVVNQLKWNV